MNIDKAFLPPETFYGYQLIVCYRKNVRLCFFCSLTFTMSYLYMSFPLEALQTEIVFAIVSHIKWRLWTSSDKEIKYVKIEKNCY